MHVDPPNATGYVLDRIATTSGALLTNLSIFQRGKLTLVKLANFSWSSVTKTARALPISITTIYQPRFRVYSRGSIMTQPQHVLQWNPTLGKPLFKKREALGLILTSPKSEASFQIEPL